MKSFEVKDNTFQGRKMFKPNTDNKHSDSHAYGMTGTAGVSGINDLPTSQGPRDIHDKPVINDINEKQYKEKTD